MATITLHDQESLLATDRCDRCGAQAYLKVRLPMGTELLFCSHHAEAHLPKLLEIEGATVDDHRPFLAARTEKGS